MKDWDSKQYLKFKSQRTQPAIDLVMRVANYKFKTIADIGCGPGNSTDVLKEIFPESNIIGIDNSPNMIEKAKSGYPDIKFKVCDATALDGKYDLLFSNACLQWIDNHEKLIPSLMERLNDGGVLAVQIPMNGAEPLFKLIDEVAADPKWGFQNTKLKTNKTLNPNEYFDILESCSSSFEIWQTKYYHALPNHRALVEWVKGTRLRPYLEYLGDDLGLKFENEIVKRAEKTYPLIRGQVLLGFLRFFFTAKK